MKLGTADQATKVARIFGDDYPIFGDAPFEDAMVRLATATHVQRMDRIVAASFVESRR